MELPYSRDQLTNGVTIFQNGMLLQVKKISTERFKQGTESLTKLYEINEKFLSLKIDNIVKHHSTIYNYHSEYTQFFKVLYSLWYRYYFLSLDIIVVGLGGESKNKLVQQLEYFNGVIGNSKFELALKDDEGGGNVEFVTPYAFLNISKKFKKNYCVFFSSFDWILDNLVWVGKNKKFINSVNKLCKDCSTFFTCRNSNRSFYKELNLSTKICEDGEFDFFEKCDEKIIRNSLINISNIIKLITPNDRVYLSFYTDKLDKLIIGLKQKGFNVVTFENKTNILEMMNDPTKGYVYVTHWNNSLVSMDNLVDLSTGKLPFDKYLYRLPSLFNLTPCFLKKTIYPLHYSNLLDGQIHMSTEDYDLLTKHCSSIVKIGSQDIEFLNESICEEYMRSKYPFHTYVQTNLNHYEITLDDVSCFINDIFSLSRDEQKNIKDNIKQWLIENRGYMDNQVKNIQICTTHQKSSRLKKLNSFSLKISDVNYCCDVTVEIMSDGTLGIVTWGEPWNKKNDNNTLEDDTVYYWQTTRGTWKIHTTAYSRSSSCSSSVVGD